MLRKFKVSNFRGFNSEISLDLTRVNNYEFNKTCIKDGVINSALVYGENGVGKSNLALALFDIIEHLTDKNRYDLYYKNYLNALSKTRFAEFYYEFLFDSNIVVYKYIKIDYKTIVFESFSIDGVTLIEYDRRNGSHGFVKLAGAESLKTNLENNQLSILKYVKNNSDLSATDHNSVFSKFFEFIDKMLFFRSLSDKFYFGFDVGETNILQSIITKGNIEDFELFLNTAGINCKLSKVSELGKETIAFDFNGVLLSFGQVASTGTNALTLFYFWYQSIKNTSAVSFVFIDEFDAFYHHSLSALIVEKLKETGVQFILTTHSTSLMTNDLMRPDCYFLMTKEKIKSLPNCTEKELREAHNLEKIYKAGGFDVR